MPAQPRKVSDSGRTGRYHEISIFGFVCNRKIRFDAAALVEPLGIDDLADRHGDIGGADLIQDPLSITTFDEELRKR